MAVAAISGLGSVRVSWLSFSGFALALAFALGRLPALALAFAFANGIKLLAFGGLGGLLRIPGIPLLLSVFRLFTCGGSTLAIPKGTETQRYSGPCGLV